jgi:hypothetical protein
MYFLFFCIMNYYILKKIMNFQPQLAPFKRNYELTDKDFN